MQSGALSNEHALNKSEFIQTGCVQASISEHSTIGTVFKMHFLLHFLMHIEFLTFVPTGKPCVVGLEPYRGQEVE